MGAALALALVGACLLPFAAKERRARKERSLIAARLVAAGLAVEGQDEGLELDVLPGGGFEATFDRPGQTPENVEALLERAAPAFGSYSCDARRLSATRWRVRFLEEGRPYPAPSRYADHPTLAPPDIRSLHVAFDAEGEPIVADATVHALTSALSGAGKSGLLNIMLARLAYSAEVALFGIDLKRGLELSPWEERFTCLARDVGEAVSLLSAVEEIMNARFDEMESLGLRKTEPSRGVPWLFLVIDEIAQLRGGDKGEQKEIERLLVALSSLGRAAGITLWVSTQRPGVEVIPGGDNVRSNLAVRNVLRLANREQLRVSLGWTDGIGERDNPIRFPLDEKGLCLFTHPEQRVGRVVYVEDEDVKGIVSDTKHLAVPVEKLRTAGGYRLNGRSRPVPAIPSGGERRVNEASITFVDLQDTRQANRKDSSCR